MTIYKLAPNVKKIQTFENGTSIGSIFRWHGKVKSRGRNFIIHPAKWCNKIFFFNGKIETVISR